MRIQRKLYSIKEKLYFQNKISGEYFTGEDIKNALRLSAEGTDRHNLKEAYKEAYAMASPVDQMRKSYKEAERKIKKLGKKQPSFLKNLSERIQKGKKVIKPRRKLFSQKNPILGTFVDIIMDRPIGYIHHGHRYPINYGYVPGLLGGDGEEQDVYLLGPTKPLKEYKQAKVIAVIHRLNDNEDKWVACPKDMSFTKEEILEKVNFMEQYFKNTIEVL